jgi:AbrB family looped-hinge helix DNA binding protein
VDVVKLGPKGHVSIPRSILRRLGLEGDRLLVVEATEDGAILLRPVGAYPIEIYSDDRIASFLAEDDLPAELAERIAAISERRRG